VEYKRPLRTLLSDVDGELNKDQLTQEEWTFAEELARALTVFKKATLLFSAANATVGLVIPAMDRIDQVLEKDTDLQKFSPTLRAALDIGRQTLNRYYSKTDDSEVYRIAMILHPRNKTRYFKKSGWEAEWIELAVIILRKRWTAYYKHMDIDDADEEPSKVNRSTSFSSTSSSNFFDDLYMEDESDGGSDDDRDELDTYLNTDCDHKVEDPIVWWIQHRPVYRRLSRMALDYLTIPASSVEVERVFSKGRLVLSHLRNRLEAQSTRALMCLGDWSLLDLVDKGDLEETAQLPDVQDGEGEILVKGWDKIKS